MTYQSQLTLIFGVSLFLTLFIGLNCYNIEVNKVGIYRGPPGSQFGYSVAFVRAPGWTNTSEEKEFYTKQLLVGAPNLDYDNITAHGQIAGCAHPDKRDLDCRWLNVTDDTCIRANLKQNGSDSDCAFESRLGATLVVNRQFPEVQDRSSTIPMVTVCAPYWKNVYPENNSQKYQHEMIGMCLKLRDDLRPINCSISDRKYCFPFWPYTHEGTDSSGKDSRPVFNFAQGGMSATFTNDGLSEIIGGPGSDDWRGAFIAPQKNWEVRQKTQRTTILFGYSLGTGKLKNGEFVISGIPNYYNKFRWHSGKIEIYIEGLYTAQIEYGVPARKNCKGWPVLDLRNLIKDQQAGTKFGASVVAVDLTGDGNDEIVVGAPLYSEKSPEEGRVFVYMFEGNGVCGPIGVLSGRAKSESLADKASFARFGSAIASAGDLDLDGNKDLAVGSPYEDDGHGALYIYLGIGPCMCEMKDVFAQRIAGASIDSGIRNFGWSIYGDEDVDDNSFPDLAVGAYKSDMAVVLRSRPIVNVDVKMEITPSPIPLNGTQLQCSRDKEELCFNVTVNFQFASVGRRKGSLNNITISCKLDSDTLYRKEKIISRVEFNGTAGLESITENITLFSKNNTVKTFTLFVKKYNGKPEPRDAWTNIQMEGTFQLVPFSGQAFDALDPILNRNAHNRISESVEFDKKCDSLDQCTSDLSLNVEMFLLKANSTARKVENNTIIYVGAFNELEITAEVKNIADSSYQANLTKEVAAQTKRGVSSNNGRIDATCRFEHQVAEFTCISCLANSKLDQHENFKVKSYFDIAAQRLVPDMDIDRMRQNISIRMHARQANTDTTPNNNDFERTINIKLKYHVHIVEDKEKSDQVRYTADDKSTRRIRLVHAYDIINEGPSFLPMSYVNVSIPLTKTDVVLAVIADRSTICENYHEILPLEEIITPNHDQSIERVTIQAPDPGRRRRQDGSSTDSAATTSTTVSSSSNSKDITCKDYECAKLMCKIVKLGRQQQQTIEVTLDILENEIAKIAKENQNTRQIRYLTTATLTDPSIWFGEKVVPLEKTVNAEKWTTLLVEPTSLVPQVNIWIIIGSVLGGVALLLIVIVALWRCGFFARAHHYRVQEWKKSSLYNRKSERLSSCKSTSIQQEHTTMDAKDKTE